MTRTRTKVAIAVLALILLTIGFLVYRVMFQTNQNRSDVPVFTPTPSTSSSKAPQPSSKTPAPKSTTPLPAGCSAHAPMDKPKRMIINSMKVDTQVLSLGLDESGAAAAPPKNDTHSVAWFNKGPKLGAAKGNAVLSSHTYRNGGALGNELYDKKNGLKPGALIKFTDDSGKTLCYTYKSVLKVWVKDYDPNSSVLYDDEGAPQAVMVICWDFDWGTKIWDSRLLFYLTPVG